jgi:hypothetical protein
MMCSALGAVTIFVLIAVLATELNLADERTDPLPDPFRLHRFRSGDQEIE